MKNSKDTHQYNPDHTNLSTSSLVIKQDNSSIVKDNKSVSQSRSTIPSNVASFHPQQKSNKTGFIKHKETPSDEQRSISPLPESECRSYSSIPSINSAIRVGHKILKERESKA